MRCCSLHICTDVQWSFMHRNMFVAYMHAKISTEICQTYMTYPGLALRPNHPQSPATCHNHNSWP